MTVMCPSEGKIEIRFTGKLDTATCQEIEPGLREKLAGDEAAIVFDLAEVDFVGSTFLRLCMMAYQKAGAGSFQVINVSPAIKKVFMIAGMDAMLGITAAQS